MLYVFTLNVLQLDISHSLVMQCRKYVDTVSFCCSVKRNAGNENRASCISPFTSILVSRSISHLIKQIIKQIIMSQALQTLSDILQTWLLYMVQWYYVVLDMYSDCTMYTPWYMTTVIVQYHSINQSTKVFNTITIPWYCHNTFC